MSKPKHNWGRGEKPKRNRPREYWRNRAIVLREAGNQCAIRLEGICTGHADEADHIIPESQATKELQPDGAEILWADKAAGIGIHAIPNLRAACKACNAEMNHRLRPRPKRPPLGRPPEKHPGLI